MGRLLRVNGSDLEKLTSSVLTVLTDQPKQKIIHLFVSGIYQLLQLVAFAGSVQLSPTGSVLAVVL